MNRPLRSLHAGTPSKPAISSLFAAGALLLFAHPQLHAQTPGMAAAIAPLYLAAVSPAPSASTAAEPAFSSSVGAPATGAASLPDAPLPQPSPQASVAGNHQPAGDHVAGIHSEYIPAGWTAPRLTARDKVIAGLEDAYSWENLLAIPISASYEYGVNSEPNYSPSDAFGKRLGAAAIRETSQTLFTESVLAPTFHEDARYYQLGVGHSFLSRTFYAVTRPLITRTDGGNKTINAALLGGYAGAAALTPLYYPSINRNFHDTASTFGGSIGGAALGDFVSEFADDVLTDLHLKHKQ